MGKKKKNDDQETKVVVAEFKVSMHCNACERIVAKILLKMKGVEKFATDMNKHRVVVTGKIDPEKVLKKLRKKTGKKVEIIDNTEEKPHDAPDEGDSRQIIIHPLMFDCCKESDQLLMMFSDENPNACSIM